MANDPRFKVYRFMSQVIDAAKMDGVFQIALPKGFVRARSFAQVLASKAVFFPSDDRPDATPRVGMLFTNPKEIHNVQADGTRTYQIEFDPMSDVPTTVIHTRAATLEGRVHTHMGVWVPQVSFVLSMADLFKHVADHNVLWGSDIRRAMDPTWVLAHDEADVFASTALFVKPNYGFEAVEEDGSPLLYGIHLRYETTRGPEDVVFEPMEYGDNLVVVHLSKERLRELIGARVLYIPPSIRDRAAAAVAKVSADAREPFVITMAELLNRVGSHKVPWGSDIRRAMDPTWVLARDELDVYTSNALFVKPNYGYSMHREVDSPLLYGIHLRYHTTPSAEDVEFEPLVDIGARENAPTIIRATKEKLRELIGWRMLYIPHSGGDAGEGSASGYM